MLHTYLVPATVLVLVIYSVLILVSPPKFDNKFYGVSTNWTIKNAAIWAAGQKLFGMAILMIGIIVLLLKYVYTSQQISNIQITLIIYVLAGLSRFVVHKVLSRKFSSPVKLSHSTT
jgi:uncharacterized membrane protein